MYNGYKNYETWNIALWISNDQGLYELAKECKDYLEFKERMRDLGMTETPDEVAFNDSGLDTNKLNEILKEI